MNSKKITVIALLGIVVVAFLFAMNFYQKQVQTAETDKVSKATSRLVRFHSPTLGPSDAPVTIVEFFDPACETCRDFYPLVKDLMKKYPNEVRLVLRYAPLHAGSDQVVKFLEAAKRQNKYWPTLEAVLAAQPSWASHGTPNLEGAYQAAAKSGLDVSKALSDARGAEVEAVLKQDIEDLTALAVTKTPTFFVNGRALPSFGLSQLTALVAEEVAKNKK